ncbi:MAG: cupredoxin domain-containing protein [Chloroflexota bacterium]|nr:cupredoxin domain-containing protein [Chloroflexota bacterium]
MHQLTFRLIATAGIAAAACSAGTAQTPSVRVTLSDFTFAPMPIEVPANTKVAFQLTNSGSVEHDVTAKDLGLHLHVGTAKRVEEVVGPFKPGTYDIYCGIAGHREVGMVGKVVVK